MTLIALELLVTLALALFVVIGARLRALVTFASVVLATPGAIAATVLG